MRRIAVLVQRTTLPAMLAGSLAEYGGVTTVWDADAGALFGCSADHHRAAMPSAVGVPADRFCFEAVCTADGRAENAQTTHIAQPECYCGAQDYLLSVARSAERLSLAANTHTADILAATDCRSGHLMLGNAVVPVIASDSRRLRKALHGSPNGALCCGTGHADTITLSSVDGDRLLVTLQRELTTLAGNVVEPCDVRVHLPSEHTGLMDALITTAVLLLCGCPHEPGYQLRQADTFTSPLLTCSRPVV